jgi:hypothetical protein
MQLIRKFLREPLVHFLALGAMVFALFQTNASRDTPLDARIVINPAKVEQFITVFSRTWHRPPSQQELEALIEDYIKEEVLYREALVMGLDKDDIIVRRRMRQKLEFLTEDASVTSQPTAQDLQRWLDSHPDNFRVGPSIAFTHVYYNASRVGDSAFVAASKALARIDGAGRDSAAPDRGDKTMLPSEFPLSPLGEVARLFGDDFSQQIAKLAANKWAGPIQSGYGWHLVYISERIEDGARPLADVYEAVQREWTEARHKEIVEATYRKLRERYAIVVETPLTQAQAAPTGSRSAANVPER